MADTTYTVDQVNEAVTAGIQMIMNDEELVLSDSDHDLMNLVGNTILSVLNDPSLTLDQVIEGNYQASPETVKGWIA